VSNQASIRKASKVILAQGRLDDAVAWLESVVNLKNSSLNEPSHTDNTDILQKEIKQLKQENLALKQVNNQVSTRLSVAIKRLRTVIGD
jgi:type II secretory pathway component PulC